MVDFLMPRLGADMTEATLVAWKIRPGDQVSRGMVIAEVDTAKGVIDVECFQPGKVIELVAREGQLLPVGAILARIEGAAGPPAEGSKSEVKPGHVAKESVGEAGAARETTAGWSEQLPDGQQETASAGSRRRLITPRARRLAEQAGFEWSGVMGTGPDGAISAADIEQAVKNPSNQVVSGSGVKIDQQQPPATSRMREAIAATMEQSNREIPHYYLRAVVDMTAALAWLRQENESRSVAQRILPVTVSLKAMGLALREVPELNGFWREGRFQPGNGIHVGFAVSMRGGGLVTPAIHDVDRSSLDQLMERLTELIPRARNGRLKSSELTDGTCTLTSLGDLGVAAVWGVIYPPQVALIGTGQIAVQPWVVNAQVLPRPLMEVTLAGDHRASDGLVGARFLEVFSELLQTPQALRANE